MTLSSSVGNLIHTRLAFWLTNFPWVIPGHNMSQLNGKPRVKSEHLKDMTLKEQLKPASGLVCAEAVTDGVEYVRAKDMDMLTFDLRETNAILDTRVADFDDDNGLKVDNEKIK